MKFTNKDRVKSGALGTSQSIFNAVLGICSYAFLAFLLGEERKKQNGKYEADLTDPKYLCVDSTSPSL